MIDEREEFDAYTGPVVYDAQNKQDNSYLGRFTFDTLLKGEGLQRILTILREVTCGRPVNRTLTVPVTPSGPGAASRTAKTPSPRRPGSTGRISGSFTGRSRSWWTNRATAGLSATFTGCGTSSNTTRRR